jgi:serine phosphatase RsbU (regulator of sigma subunit)
MLDRKRREPAGPSRRRKTTAEPVFGLTWLPAVVAASLALVCLVGWGEIRAEVDGRARAEAERTVARVADHLRETDGIYAPLSRVAVQDLRIELQKLGRPSLQQSTNLPTLHFGGRAANDDVTLVDPIADSTGADISLMAASDGGFRPVATTLRRSDGKRDLSSPLAPEVAAALNAGRAFTGSVKIGGRTYIAHLEPILDEHGHVIGAFAAQYANETLDELSREFASIPVLAHGFLAVFDRHGKLMFGSASMNPQWLTDHATGLISGGSESWPAVAPFRISRARAPTLGQTVVAGVYMPDLLGQALNLEGTSQGWLALEISLSLLLALSLARRMSKALDLAHRSRQDAEQARAKAEQLRAEAEQVNSALASELKQAARYVESLLPQRASEGPVLANWIYRPCAGVGGDAFGYHWLDDDHFAFYLLDVCGHGVGAALLATTVMNVIRSQTIAGADFKSPSSALTVLNDAFQMDSHNGMYFTIWYGVFEPVTRTVRFASAGHHPAVLVAPDGTPRLLKGQGMPIGWFDKVNYPETVVPAPPGSRIYVFSDGMFEVERKGRTDMFTFEEFVNTIMHWLEYNNERDMEYLVEVMQNIQGKPAFDDDCALIELRFGEAREMEAAA